MTKNEIITLEITGITSEGSGIGRYGGMAVFVPYTAVGDVIECRIVKVNKTYAYGKIENIVKPSADRIENDCPVYGKCGGCVFRHISYEAELRAKESFVRDAFERIGGLNPEFLPIQGSEPSGGSEPCDGSDYITEYRNKLQMPLSKDDNGKAYCGFFAERSHRVVPVENCLLQPKIFGEITRFLVGEINRLHISVYSEERHEGVLRHIYLRKGHYSGEICLCLVARRKVPEFKKLAASVTEKFPEIKSVVLNINPERTNVILGEREEVLSGAGAISDTMCGIKVEISPKSFYQVNTPAAENLYRQAALFAEPTGKTVLDLYCGAGTIGLSMASGAKKIIGVEIVPEAIENAKENAFRNNITNAEFFCADSGQAAKKIAGGGAPQQVPDPASAVETDIDVIVLDPPRKGCDEQTLSACVEMNPKRIVMVSCNPATAARDCRILADSGYVVERVRAFDLFPRTAHVECVTLLAKEK